MSAAELAVTAEASPRRGRVAVYRDLPLAWKLVLPMAAFLLAIGTTGTFVVVRSLNVAAHDTLRGDLSRRALSAEASFIDAELSLLDAARFAANQRGMPEAVGRRDAAPVVAGLRSVLALKGTLDFVAVTDTSGNGLVELSRTGAEPASGAPFHTQAIVAAALADPMVDKHAGFLSYSGARYAVVVSPVRAPATVGVAIAGMAAERVARDASRRASAPVTVRDDGGRVVASVGRAFADAETMRVPLPGRRGGSIEVAVDRAAALAPVRQTALRLALLMTLAVIAVAALGALVMRSVLTRLRRLVEAGQALGDGDLGVRAAVHGSDEVDRLAAGFNEMADRLQASYESLEAKVDERTRELALANDELAASAQAQSDFFSRMMHELRAPLFVIRGNASMLRDAKMRPRAQSERARMLDAIKDSGDVVVQTLNELLDVKRLEAGRMPVDLRDVDLRALVLGMLPSIRPMCDLGGHRLRVEVPEDLPAVRADPRHVETILRNLVSNAVKYTRGGGEVSVSASQGPGTVRLVVADTGVGIPPGVGDKVFEVFYRVPDAGDGQPSSGLGLALCRELVQAMDGSISYSSRPGKGSAFTVSLPTLTE